MSISAQGFSGIKYFESGAVTSLYDIRNPQYAGGAISAPDTTTAAYAVNNARPAILATIAAWTQVGSGTQFQLTGPVGGVDLGTGNYYIDAPIVVPHGLWMYGDAPWLANLIPGPGTPSTPSLVQGFAGPMLYMGGINPGATAGNGFPSYTTPLVGATGQSMVMTTFSQLNPNVYPPTMVLDDSWAWSAYLQWFAAEVALQCWAQVTSAWSGTDGRQIIGVNAFIGSNQAIKLYVTSDGTNIFFNAAITTSITGYQLITSSACSPGTPYNLEIDYDGSYFDFYVAGVNQGHVAMTGRILKNPLDSASLGDAGNELTGYQQYQMTGAVDSIRLSNTARHTGTGSFVPPVAKYAWDANTLWLCNFDQTAPSVAMPFLRAQTVVTTISNYGMYFGPPSPTTAAATPGPIGGPNTHYCPFSGWTQVYQQYYGPTNCTLENFQLICGSTTSGIRAYSASFTQLNNVWTSYGTAWGIQLIDGFSFFSGIQNCQTVQTMGCGIGYLVERGGFNLLSGGNGVDYAIMGGQVVSAQSQTGWNSYVPFVIGGLGGEFSPVSVSLCSVDDEGIFPYQICAAYMQGDSQMFFYANTWAANAAKSGSPAVIYAGAPAGGATHLQDAFFPGAGGVCISTLNKTPFLSLNNPGPAIQAISCEWFGSPVSDIPGLVGEFRQGALTNHQSLSVTATAGSNLAGTFDILYGYSVGGPIFPTPEPDGRYIPIISYLGYSGSTPASGSTVPGPTTNILDANGKSTGFQMNQGVMQTGTCTTHWAYVMVRIPGAALGSEYLPTIPSTMVNPLATVDPTGFPWYVGVTLVPAVANSLYFDNTLADQVVVEMGAYNTNWWQLRINNGYQARVDIGAGALGLLCDSFVSNGKLYGVMNPGSHNIVFGLSNLVPTLDGYAVSSIYVDGALGVFFLGTNNQSAGTQQTPIQVGQHLGGTEQLTVATIRRIEVDTQLSQVVYYEQDAGPQPGNTIAAIFGDQMTLGLNGASTAGGFATQIANNRYGTIYYWLPATTNATVLSDILPQFWQQWGGAQTFAGMCVMAGFNDCLNGSLGATVWAALELMLNGTPATATFNPPVQNTYAFSEYIPPTAGTASCVIDGINIPCTFSVDAFTTVNNQVAAIQANGTLNSLFTVSNGGGTPVGTAVLMYSKLPGFQGNAYTVSTDGVGGAFFFEPGGFFTGGANATITIQGVLFNSYFDTDANTTVNDLITLINASGPTAALVTPSLVSGQLLLTAVASGTGGNAITVSSNNVDGAGLVIANHQSGTLLNGVNGAIQNGINPIILCTVPPFGQAPGYSAGKEIQRNALNTLIQRLRRGWCHHCRRGRPPARPGGPPKHGRDVPLGGQHQPQRRGTHRALRTP